MISVIIRNTIKLGLSSVFLLPYYGRIDDRLSERLVRGHQVTTRTLTLESWRCPTTATWLDEIEGVTTMLGQRQ